MNPAESDHPQALDSTKRHRKLTCAAVCVCYLAGAAAITWPLIARLTTHLPLGTELVATVPLFNAWTLWWNCSQLSEGFASYWTAPIFAPTRGTFTFSEMQPTMLIVAPVWYASRNLALGYNVYLLLSLWLNAVFGYWFCRRVAMSVSAAFGGGALVLCLPYVHWQLGVLQLAPLWPALWLWGELTAYSRSDRTPSRWRLGLAFAAVYLTCHHYGLFLSLLLPVCSVVLIPLGQLRNRRFWMSLATNGLLAGLLLAPFVFAQLHYLQKNIDSERDLDLVNRLSAEIGDYTVTSSDSWFSSRHFAQPERAKYWPLSPGYLVWGLAAAGLLGGLFERDRRRIVLFLSMIVVVGAILSMGPRFHPNGFSLYERFVLKWPGFSQVRNIFRYAVFVQLAAALLAAAGLNLLVRLGNTFGLHRCWGILAAIVFTSASAAETWPRSQQFASFLDLARHEKWIDWLRTKTEPDALVATVPFSRGGNADAYLISTQAMILGTAHQRRLVNGYSGFFPQSYIDLRREAVHFPDPAAIEALREAGAGYVIDLRLSEFVSEEFEWMEFLPEGIDLEFFDSQSNVAIYRIPPLDTKAAD